MDPSKSSASTVSQSDGLQNPARLHSLDIYRGIVMLLLAAGSVALTPKILASIYPDNDFWGFMAKQWTHANWRSSTVDWSGFRLWDLIQPSFMFMVGVSVPFSYGKRQQLGDSYWRMFGHACYRAAFLILLGVILRSLRPHVTSTYWTFEDVVTQIGLGYVFLFLLWDRSWKAQAGTALGIVIGYWALWRFWPTLAPLFGLGDTAIAGWPESYDPTQISATPGQAFDVWFLNFSFFNRPGGFTNHAYYTLNFIPALATMIGGLLAGHLLRSNLTGGKKITILGICGLAGIALGLGFDWLGICPIIKKIWTPSWVFYSGGVCALVLGAIYAIVDVWGLRRGTLFFVVFGVNSIAIYILTWTLCRPLNSNLAKHLNHTIFRVAPENWRPLLVSVLAFAIVWLAFYWMYRRKVFIKI